MSLKGTAYRGYLLEFDVTGQPATKGNHRVNAAGHLYDADNNLGAWSKQVAWTARARYRQAPLAGPLVLHLAFRLRAPSKIPAARRGYPCVKPDLDKLTRAIKDALKDIVYLDDGQVVDLHATKRYCELGVHPGVTIAVEVAP